MCHESWGKLEQRETQTEGGAKYRKENQTARSHAPPPPPSPEAFRLLRIDDDRILHPTRLFEPKLQEFRGGHLWKLSSLSAAAIRLYGPGSLTHRKARQRKREADSGAFMSSELSLHLKEDGISMAAGAKWRG